MNYSYSYSYTPSSIAALGPGYIILLIVISIISIICLWKLFVKAGEAGWKSLIPLLNVYEEFKIVYGNGWMFLLLLIPVANIVFLIKFIFDLAKAYGKSVGFGFGLLFLSMIFMIILAFDHSEYQGTVKEIRAASEK